MAGEAFGLGGGKRYDRMVMMTYPVDVRTVPEEHKQIYRELAASGVDMVFYPGSVEGSCEDCGTQVYIGPNQQQRLRDQPDIAVLCAYCAGKVVALTEATYDLESAGEDFNHNGIPRVFVNSGPDAKGHLVTCVDCGRQARMLKRPGKKVAVCPDCMRKRGL